MVGRWVALAFRGSACPRAGRLAPKRGHRLVEQGLLVVWGGMGALLHTHTRGGVGFRVTQPCACLPPPRPACLPATTLNFGRSGGH